MNHKTLNIFLIFLFLYITVGFWLCYNNTFILDDNNIFFGSDCARVFKDLTERVANHYRIAVHPLMLILLQPVVSLIDSFFKDPHRTVIVFQSIIASANVCLVFSILKSLTKNKSTSLIFASLYGISFSTLIFTALPETYIFSAFSQLLLWHYAIRLTQKSDALSWKNILVISFLGILSTGIILSNAITFIITVIWLLWRIYAQNIQQGLINFAKIILTSCALLVFFAWLQKYCFIHTPFFLEKLGNAFSEPRNFEDFKYLDFNFSLEKINETFVQMFSAPILAPNLFLIPGDSETIPDFQINSGFSWKNLVVGISLYILPLVIFFKNFKSTKNIDLLATIAIIILINSILLFVYGSKECFIYSQNYLYLIFIFAGIVTNNHGTEIFYRLFFQLVLIFNILTLREIDITIFNFTLVNNFCPKWIFQSLVITTAIGISAIGLKKFFKNSSPPPACPAHAGQPVAALSNTPRKSLASETFSDRYFYWVNFYFIFILLSAVLSNISKIRG